MFEKFLILWNEYCGTMVNPCNHVDLRFEWKW